MPNHEEVEQVLRELFQNVQTVPGTLPPVYTCSNFLIGFDGQGQVKVTGSIRTEPEPSPTKPHWLKSWQARFLSSPRWGQISQKLPASWFRRWCGERSPLVKVTEIR